MLIDKFVLFYAEFSTDGSWIAPDATRIRSCNTIASLRRFNVSLFVVTPEDC